MNTYGDMVTLLLTFFVMMFTVATSEQEKMQLVIASFNGMGLLQGGNTLQVGKLAELGNTIENLPSMEKGRALDRARKKAISQFEPEIKSNKIRVTEDERGLIITLAGDAFFRPASAEVEIEETRELLIRLSSLLKSLPDRKFRIEGHTDSTPTDPGSEWPTNWELSAARSINVLKYLTEFGVSETQFQVAGFADTVPLMSNETPEGRAYNRRVDIVILLEGHQ
jgi:chemotaxis protein MotB